MLNFFSKKMKRKNYSSSITQPLSIVNVQNVIIRNNNISKLCYEAWNCNVQYKNLRSQTHEFCHPLVKCVKHSILFSMFDMMLMTYRSRDQAITRRWQTHEKKATSISLILRHTYRHLAICTRAIDILTIDTRTRMLNTIHREQVSLDFENFYDRID